MESAASAPQPDDNAQTVFAAIPGEDLHSEPTQREAGLLGALRAACSIANVRFTDTMTANELLVSLLAKRDPSSFPQASQLYAMAQHPSHGGGVRANFLREDHNIDGKEIAADPLLTFLRNTRRDACALGSVRQAIPGPEHGVSLDVFENAKLAAINIGDVVQYKEVASLELVMAVVLGIRSKRDSRSGTVNVVHARRLYTYSELLKVLDSISSYRKNPKLTHVRFSETNADLQSDDDFKRALAQHQTLKRQLKNHFSSNLSQRVVLMTAVSDCDMFLRPDEIFRVLHATMNPKIYEKIDARPQADPNWPTKEGARSMLGGVTVMWKSFLNTKRWTLHPIELTVESMVRDVLLFEGRTLYWAPQIVTRGLAGIFRRYVREKVRQLGSVDLQARQCVLSVPCCFSFFSHLLLSTRHSNNRAVDKNSELIMTWQDTTRTWTATWESPSLLDVQLGCNWGSMMLADGRIIQVTGPVVMSYSHNTPDKVRFTMTKVSLSVDGGMSLDMEPDENDNPAEDPGY